MRKLASLGPAAFAVACAGGPGPPASVGPGSILLGRVVATQEVSSFIGDVEVIWYSHVVEPIDAPGTRLIVLADTNACPVPGDSDAIYRMSFRERRESVGIRRGQGQDASLVSNLVISSCVPIESSRNPGTRHLIVP